MLATSLLRFAAWISAIDAPSLCPNRQRPADPQPIENGRQPYARFLMHIVRPARRIERRRVAVTMPGIDQRATAGRMRQRSGKSRHNEIDPKSFMQHHEIRPRGGDGSTKRYSMWRPSRFS